MAVWSIIESNAMARSGRWDAEYFSPGNLGLEAVLEKHAPQRIDSFAEVTDGIHASPEWANDGVPYLSAKSVREHSVDVNAAGHITHVQDEANARTRARVGDVIISSVGTIGNAAVVEDWMLPANMDRHVGIIRIHNKRAVDPYYLATFLNCEFGRFQTLRESTGNVQLNLFIAKIRGIRVPLADCLQKVGRTVRKTCAELHAAESFYPDAEREMLDRLGWERLCRQSPELTYVCDFASLAGATRMDAEFFQPQYARLRDQLGTRGALPIRDFCPKPMRGVQPQVLDDGEVVIVDSRAVRAIGVDPTVADRTSLAFYQLPQNAKARVHCDDVLLNSTGRGTLGRATFYHPKELAVCDNHVTILRPDPRVCSPVYLSLFLNSPAGLAQSEQSQTGSSGQLEIYPQHIQQFLVYLPQRKNGGMDTQWQERLAAKVIAARTARVSARAKLDEAKRLVETTLSRL